MTKYTGSIVITGMGAISPLGVGVEAFWSALIQGERRGVVLQPEKLQDQDGPAVVGLKVGEDIGWKPAELIGKRGLQYLRSSTQFLLGAAVLAQREAALTVEQTNPDDLGVTVGSNLAGLQSISNYDYTVITEGPQYVSPMEAPNTLANAPASHLAIRAKARALNTTIATGQCAGLDTLGYAAKTIREERARQIIAGAVEELSPAALWVYRNSRVLPTEHSENAGRPYSEESSGWLPGEGAAVLVVERQDAAQARGVRPLAELLGWSSGFAPTASLEKRAQVLRRVAQQALDVAGVTAEDINVVLAGASGWQQQDQAEALALRGLLAHNSHVAVTAIKGTLGETYGAGGLFQAVAAVNIIQHGIVPPTLGGGSLVEGLLSEARVWPGSKQGTALLLTQDLFGSTSAVVLRGFQA